MMSRRKQQNPKPLKYNESSVGPSQISDPTGEEVSNETVKSPSPDQEPITEPQTEVQPIIKEEPESPQTAVEPASPVRVEVDDKILLPTTLPSPNLENLLGVPDSAPLKVQRNSAGGYKILSAKYIAQGAGLDPLKARRIDASEEKALLEGKLQVVSFSNQHLPGERVYFHLESSINCGWLKCLGEPDSERSANVNIYYAGDQLWVEVVQDLNEGEQLIAEFKEPNRQRQPTSPQENGPQSVTSAPTRSQPSAERASVEAQFPCSLCGVQFRNPNTLMAHRKHYCSKLASPSSTTTAVSADQDSVGAANEIKELTDNLQQSAYICLMCKFMSLTEADMKSHVKDKHKMKQEAEVAVGGSTNDNTYCEDCDIHFKKPESYQAHKLHYCKHRTSSTSPRSDSGGNQSISQSSSPLSPFAKEACYKKVSVFDNQALSASIATQAALAAASLPFTLSSMLNLPATMGALPMMPHLKMFQSPALLAQAVQSAVQATNAGVTASTSTAGSSQREETPLDLTVKSDTSSLDGTSTNASTKRTMSSEREEVASKKQALSNPASPALPLISPRVNGHVKPLKPERPIYRCESCSIPFYKKDVYEAHKLHYCSRRPSSGSEKEEEMPTRPAKPERQSPLKAADDRLVITYTCNKCSTSYRTIETFNAHQCTVIAQPQPLLRCDECNFTTQSSRALAEHAEGHQKVNIMFKCKLCGYHGNTLRGMRQHGRQHMLKGEEFNDNDVESMELQPSKNQLPVGAGRAPFCHDVDEELLRLKNEPYKKRRSRKHYQKSEYTAAVSPQPKENGLHRSRSSSPHSTSTVSCTSPLQLSTTNVLQNDRVLSSPPANVKVKKEPTEHVPVDPKTSHRLPVERSSTLADKQANPVKRYVCSCNTAFASVSTFEAHKKLYCSHHKSQRSNPTIAVNH